MANCPICLRFLDPHCCIGFSIPCRSGSEITIKQSTNSGCHFLGYTRGHTIVCRSMVSINTELLHLLVNVVSGDSPSKAFEIPEIAPMEACI